MVFSARRKICEALLDDYFSFREPQNHGSDRKAGSDRRYGIGKNNSLSGCGYRGESFEERHSVQLVLRPVLDRVVVILKESVRYGVRRLLLEVEKINHRCRRTVRSLNQGQSQRESDPEFDKKPRCLFGRRKDVRTHGTKAQVLPSSPPGRRCRKPRV